MNLLASYLPGTQSPLNPTSLHPSAEPLHYYTPVPLHPGVPPSAPVPQHPRVHPSAPHLGPYTPEPLT